MNRIHYVPPESIVLSEILVIRELCWCVQDCCLWYIICGFSFCRLCIGLQWLFWWSVLKKNGLGIYMGRSILNIVRGSTDVFRGFRRNRMIEEAKYELVKNSFRWNLFCILYSCLKYWIIRIYNLIKRIVFRTDNMGWYWKVIYPILSDLPFL